MSKASTFVVRSGRSAFTLIELMLVLVILGVLAAIVVPKLAGRGEDAKKQAVKPTLTSLGTALDQFEVDNQRYPTNDEGLGALLNPPSDAPNWKGPYISGGIPKDPWQEEIIYRYPGTVNIRGFDLISKGPDKKENTDDDITNFVDTAAH